MSVEPVVSQWIRVSLAGLVDRVATMTGADGKLLVLVDGRSGAGKSTLADRLADGLGAALVHTDDIAWHLDPIDWADQLIEGVLMPWRAGDPVSYRPPGWITHDRPGAVQVPVIDRLVVEGVGAGRAQLAALAELVTWVQSDPAEAERRGLARDVEQGRCPQEAKDFWDDWMQSENPFFALDKPWGRAELIINGIPAALPESLVEVAAGPLRQG